jgi:hypothetical protein
MPTRKWTYEKIKEESLKYTTRNDFRLGSPGAYIAARNIGIMSEVVMHMGKSKCERQYTKEEILQSARKYKNQRDWKNNEISIFRCAAGYNKTNKSKEERDFWLECISHMEYVFKPNGYWTYERCKDASKKFKTLREFHDNPEFNVAYQRIYRNGWTELFEHLELSKKPKGHWTYESCREIALSYEYSSDFVNECGGAYNAIKKNNWGELISHLKHKSSNYYRYIYSFEFPDNHVYVGLTHNLNKRKSDHLNNVRGTSPVFKHIKKTGLDYEFKVVFEEPFHKDIAGKMEGKVLHDYISRGWIPLNKAKPGALGGDRRIWTYEKIKEELVGIKTITDARNKLPNHVFPIIRENGWVDDFIKPLIDDSGRTNWTVELALERMKGYSVRSELQSDLPGLYKFLVKSDLIKLIPISKPVRKFLLKDKYTKEEVYEKCLEFSNCEDLKKWNREYYTCARKNGWWEDIVQLVKKKRGIKSKYSYEDCLTMTLRYKHKSDFQEKNSGMFKVILKNGWWGEMSKHMVPKPMDRYKLEEVIEICKGYTKRGELQKEKSGVYKYIKRHNLIDELIPFNRK